MPVLQAVTDVASRFDLTERPCSPVSAWYPQLVAGEDAGTSRNDREEVVPGSPGVPVETDHYIAPGTGGHGRARVDALLPVIAAYGSRFAVFRYNETRGDKFLIMIAPGPRSTRWRYSCRHSRFRWSAKPAAQPARMLRPSGKRCRRLTPPRCVVPW